VLHTADHDVCVAIIFSVIIDINSALDNTTFPLIKGAILT